MVVSHNGIKYAVHIITCHFGDLVAKVSNCLLNKGSLAVSNIARFTELSSKQVKSALLVLIQHNCVQAFIQDIPGGFQEAARRTTYYTALQDNILHRVRFSKFLTIVSQELDKECVELLEGFLQHGRLSLQQLFERANDSKNEGNKVTLDSIKSSLCKLVDAHFVECCPDPEPCIAEPSQEESGAKKKGTKSQKIAKESKSHVECVLEAAVPMERKRFSVALINDFHIDSGRGSLQITFGEKRKSEALEFSEEVGGMDPRNVTWRANFEEFIRRLRQKACIENIRSQLDNDAAIVVSAMVEVNRCGGKKLKPDTSVPLSIDSIYEEVIKNEQGLTMERVREHLMQLGDALFVRAANESYTLDFKCILEQAQNEEVESIVKQRFGLEAYRMFRLISANGRLTETNKISDITFVDKKVAPGILFKLWKNGYLHMEKITAAQYKSQLLWQVNKLHLREHILDEMYHAALNLSLRLAHELEQENEVLGLPPDRRDGPLKDRFERIKKVKFVLESSRLKLDDAIMLFHDF